VAQGGIEPLTQGFQQQIHCPMRDQVISFKWKGLALDSLDRIQASQFGMLDQAGVD
jgi:hypothetical protein